MHCVDLVGQFIHFRYVVTEVGSPILKEKTQILPSFEIFEENLPEFHPCQPFFFTYPFFYGAHAVTRVS